MQFDILVYIGAVPSRLSLPQVLPNFVGRKKEIGNVLEKLQSFKFVCIVGPAGVGKTELAKKVFSHYVESNGIKGTYVEVTLGSSVTSLSNAVDLYRYISIFLNQDSKFAVEIENEDLLLSRIDVLQPDSLLLIDACENCANEESNEALHKWIGRLLSSRPNIKVIATSQRRLGGLLLPDTSDPNYHLDPLPEEDAVAMMTKAVLQSPFGSEHLSQRRTDLLNRLVRHCSCFPLALAIVCSLLQGGDDPQELCERLEASPESKFGALSPRFEDANIGSLQPMVDALRGCFDRLKSRNAVAYKALLVLSIIPQAFDKETMFALISKSLELLNGGTVQKAATLLKEHCFLQASMSQDGREGFRMHSLIRDFAAQLRTSDLELDCKSKSAFIKHFCSLLERIGARYHGDGPSRIQAFKEFDSNVESLALLDRTLIDKNWKAVVEQPELTSCMYALTSQRAGALFVFRLPLRHHIEALEALLGLVRRNRNELSIETVAEARVLLDLGKTMKSTWEKQYTERALQHFEDSKQLLQNQMPKSTTLRFYEADCLKSCGKVRYRLAVHKEASADMQRREALQQVEQSSEMFRELLRVLERQQCDEGRSCTPSVRDVKRNLASCLKGQGEIQNWLEGPSQARSLLQQALQYRLEADGEYDITTAKLLLSLGRICRVQSTPRHTSCPADRQKLLNESEVILLKAVNITTVCGDYGPVAGKIYFQLGFVYRDKARTSSSLPSLEFFNNALVREIFWFERSLAMMQQYDASQRDLGHIYSNLGTARSIKGDYTGAEDAFKHGEKSLDGAIASGEGDLYALANLYWSWSQTYHKQEKYDEELQCLEKWTECYPTTASGWKEKRVRERIHKIRQLQGSTSVC